MKNKQLELDLDNWEELLREKGERPIRRIYHGGLISESKRWFMNYKDTVKFIHKLLESIDRKTTKRPH